MSGSEKKVTPSSTLAEVNEALEIEGESSKLLGVLLWMITFFFWAIGVYVIASILYGNKMLLEVLIFITALVSIIIVQNITSILMITIPIIVVSLLGGILLLKAMAKSAREVMLGMFIIIPGFFIATGILMLFYFKSIIFGVVFLIIGIIGIILYIYFRDRLEVIGRTLELSAKSINQEPGQLFATFLSSLFILWHLIALSLTLDFVWSNLLVIITDERILWIIEVIVAFFGIWSLTFQKYFWDGVKVGIVHNWYRAPDVDVASFNQGLSRVKKSMGGIATFALIMSIFRMLQRQVRRQGKGQRIAQAIFSYIIGVAKAIVKFLGFFALPAMIIRNTSFKEGFKDSVNKLRDLFIEVIASSFGVGAVLAFFGLLMMFFYGGIGFTFGAYILPIFIGVPTPEMVYGILSAIGFLLVGLIPVILVFDTLNTTFKTILYEFGIDLEFAQKGQELPKRLPKSLEEAFEERIQEKKKESKRTAPS